MKNKFFVITTIVLAALLILSIDLGLNWKHQLAESRKSEQLAKAYIVQRTEMMASLAKAAMQRKGFFAALSPEESQVWSALLCNAKESPESDDLREYYIDMFSGARTTPITLDVNDSQSSQSYTIVLGTRTECMGRSWYVPDFIIYETQGLGGKQSRIRADRVKKMTEYYNGHYQQWFTVGSDSLDIKSLNRALQPVGVSL